MTDIAALKAQLERLKSVRARGTRRIQVGDRETEYRSDKDLRAAIESLQYEIDQLENPRKGFVVVNSSKGW